MLSLAATLPAAGLAGGVGSGPGLLGLACAAAFLAALGWLAAPDAPEAEAPGWLAELGRGTAAACACVLAALGALFGLLGWQVWAAQGPAAALGLVTGVLAASLVALGFGGRALRR